MAKNRFNKFTKEQIKEMAEQGVGYRKEKYEKTTDNQLNNKMRNEYGITLSDYVEILKKQNHVCAICGGIDENKRLAIDHCHVTEEIRGLLCSKCNLGLGLFRDNIRNLKNAIEYLKKFNKK